jgi:hypothetical protein
MDAVVAAGLAELDMLRREVELRMRQSFQFVALAVAAIGTGVSVAPQFPPILVGAAALSSLLWGVILDNGNRMQQIALYIALELRPVLTERADHPVLRWELFYRGATEVGAADATHVVKRAAHHIHYQTFLFAFAPPLLLSLFGVGLVASGQTHNWAAWVEAAAGVALWLNTIRLFWRSTRLTRAVRDAISSHQVRHKTTP